MGMLNKEIMEIIIFILLFMVLIKTTNELVDFRKKYNL